jgi:hypothetical protein
MGPTPRPLGGRIERERERERLEDKKIKLYYSLGKDRIFSLRCGPLGVKKGACTEIRIENKRNKTNPLIIVRGFVNVDTVRD